MSTISGYYTSAFILLPEVQGMGTSSISSFIWNTAAVARCFLGLLISSIRQELLSHKFSIPSVVTQQGQIVITLFFFGLVFFFFSFYLSVNTWVVLMIPPPNALSLLPYIFIVILYISSCM